MQAKRHGQGDPGHDTIVPHATRRQMMGLAALGILATGSRSAHAAPDSQVIWASHISLAPTWFDPAETPGLITPFMLYYALHDGLVKAMPGNPAEPCLASAYN